MEGYLHKEGAGLVKSYAKRWFKLKGTTLYYFKEKLQKEESGHIDLRKTSVQINTHKTYGFIISGPNLPREYCLAADSVLEREKWIDAIEKAIGTDEDLSDGAEQQIFTGQGNQVHKKVELKDFQILKVIGRGSFGKVMKVRLIGTDEVYAMKALRKDVLIKEGMVQNTKAEKTILQNIDHPFIVKLHWVFQTNERLYLILDLLQGGEIYFHLRQGGAFDEERAKLYAAEISTALEHLHSQGIIYRDLKPENIVLDKYGFACLTDFGLAKRNMTTNDTYTFCGTPEYLAPEVLRSNGHNKAVDWWALGTVLYEMVFGMPPFYSTNVQEMYQKILNDDLVFPEKENVSDNLKDLLRKLLVRDPKTRLRDGKAVRRHKFFEGIDMDMLLRREITPPFVPNLSGDEDKYIDPIFKQEELRNTKCDKVEPKEEQTFEDFS